MGKIGKTNAEASISLMLLGGERCFLRYKGDVVKLADLVFTALSRDEQAAALVCQVVSDFITTTKADPAKWKTLVAGSRAVKAQLAQRYRRSPRRADKQPVGAETEKTGETGETAGQAGSQAGKGGAA